MNRWAAIFAASVATLLIGCVNADSGSKREPFEPASSIDETFRWHRAHPTTTAWWDVVGEQQAWYFKNIQQIYPSVTVYRDGSVRELEYRSMEEIADILGIRPGTVKSRLSRARKRARKLYEEAER